MRPVEKKALARCEKTTSPKQLKALLCEASSKGWNEVIRALLARGVSVEAQQAGRSALAHAAMLGHDHVESVRLLLEAGANPRLPGIIETCGIACLPLLLAAGANVDGHPKGNNPLLTAIILRTEQDKALALIEAGANVNVTDTRGMTPLIHATLNGRDKVSMALLSAGADPVTIDSTGRTALRHGLETLCQGNAATESELRRVRPIVRHLAELLPGQPEDIILADIILENSDSLDQRIQNGLDPNATIRGSIGPMELSQETLRESIKLTSGVPAIPDHHAADSLTGSSPLLLWAVAAGRAKSVQLLLKRGADPRQANDNGVSPASLADSLKLPPPVKQLILDALS